MEQVNTASSTDEAVSDTTGSTHQVVTNQVPPHPDSSMTNTINYVLALITFLLGILLGYFLLRSLTNENAAVPQTEKATQGEIGLPVDTIQIQACADRKGSLYVRSGDIPVGPVYMVHEGKVIGIEFMLAKEDFLSGKSYKDLAGLNMEVDHVNVGLLSQGHEGYTRPHYHVDVYRVSKEVEEGIKCPQSIKPTMPVDDSEVISANKTSPTGLYIITEVTVGDNQTITIKDNKGKVIAENVIKLNEKEIGYNTKIMCQCGTSFKGWTDDSHFAIKIVNGDGEEYEYMVDATSGKVDETSFKKIK